MEVSGIMAQLLASQMQSIQQTAAVHAVKAAAEAEQNVVNMLQEAAQQNRTVPVDAGASRGTLVDISV